jgi:hypothetical protein
MASIRSTGHRHPSALLPFEPYKGTHTFSALHHAIPLSSLVSSLLVCHPQQGAPPTGGHSRCPINSATALPPFTHGENPCVPLVLPKSSCQGLRPEPAKSSSSGELAAHSNQGLR